MTNLTIHNEDMRIVCAVAKMAKETGCKSAVLQYHNEYVLEFYGNHIELRCDSRVVVAGPISEFAPLAELPPT